KPIFLLRTAASASFDIRDTSWPSRKYWPDVGRSRQPTMCMNVDLPEPDVPFTARNSPRGTSSDTPRSAFTSTSPTTYVLTRLRTEMTVESSGFCGRGCMTGLPRASSRSAEATARSAAARHQRVAVVLAGLRARGPEPGDAGDDFGRRLQLAAQKLRVRAVGDPEPQVHRLHLMVHED